MGKRRPIGKLTKLANLSKAKDRADDGWEIHTNVHWSRELNGKRLDYWPSTVRWSYNEVKYAAWRTAKDGFIAYDGTVEDFIIEWMERDK